MSAKGLSVGDKKSFNIGSETVIAVIAGFNHDAENDEKGITFVLQNCLNTQNKMAIDDTNVYANSYMRNTILNEIYDLLPNDLKSIIKQVTKLSDGGKVDSTIKQTQDKIWLLSYEEVGSIYYENEHISGQGILYPIFSDNASRIKNISGSPTSWWLRTSRIDYDNVFFSVNLNGGPVTHFANELHGVVFGFCIYFN